MVAKRAAGLSAVRTRHNQDSVSCRGLLNRTVFHRIGNVRLGRLHQPAGVGLLLIAVLLLGIDSTAVAQTFCDYLSGRSPTYQLRGANGFGRNNPTPRYPAAPWERVGVIGYAQPPIAIPPAIPATSRPPVISIPASPTSPTVVPSPVGTPRPTMPGTATSLQPTSSLPLQASTTTVPSAAARCGYPGSNCPQPALAGFPAAPTTTAYAPQPTSAPPAYFQPSYAQPGYSQPAVPLPTQTGPAPASSSPATSYPPTSPAAGLNPTSTLQPAAATTNPVVSAAYPGSTVAAPPTYATFLPVSSTPPVNVGFPPTYAAPQAVPVTTAMPVAPAGTACTTTGCQSLTNSTSLSLFRPTIRGFRSTLAQVPVTRWRPVLPTVSGVSVGRATLQPCNTYEWQVRRVPTWGGGSPAGLIPVVVGQDTAISMLGQRGTNALGAVPLYTTPIISGQTGTVLPGAAVPTASTAAIPVTTIGTAGTGMGANALPNSGVNVGLAPNPLYGASTTAVLPGSAVPTAASSSYPSGGIPSTVQPPAAVAPRLSPSEVPTHRPVLGMSTNGTSAAYPTLNQGASNGGPSWPPTAGSTSAAYPNPANTQPNGPQAGTLQPAFSPPNYPQPAPPQFGYSQPTTAQPSYGKPSHAQPNYAPSASGQPTYPQAAAAQPTSPQPNFPQPGLAQPTASQPGMVPFGQPVQSSMPSLGSSAAAPTQPASSNANTSTAYSSTSSQANLFPAANGVPSSVAPGSSTPPYSGTTTTPVPSTNLPGTSSGTSGGLDAAAAPASSPRNYYNVNPVPDPEAGQRSVPVSPRPLGPTSTSSPTQSGDTRFPAGMYVPISWPTLAHATTPGPTESGITRTHHVPPQAAENRPFVSPVASLPPADFSMPHPSPSLSAANRLPVAPTPSAPQPTWDDTNWNATW